MKTSLPLAACAFAGLLLVTSPGCDDKRKFGMHVCGDGECKAGEPFTCPMDCGGIQITTGGEHTCTVKISDGTVWCWGSNIYGQLGDGTLTDRPVPDEVLGLEAADAVFAGDSHNCTIQTGGGLWCWGVNRHGQLGDGTTTDAATPVEVPGMEDAMFLSVGGEHTCALREDTSVWCWGWNAFGQLGAETQDSTRTRPIKAVYISDAAYVSAGGYHTCILDTEGRVWCWGRNQFGQLGTRSVEEYSIQPVLIRNLDPVISISAGQDHTCAVEESGRAYCWGLNDWVQLGNPDVGGSSPEPGVVPDFEEAVAVSAGRVHTCALKEEGTVWCWGANDSGQMGTGGNYDLAINPVQVERLTDISYISAGGYHTCAVESAGTLWCWGYNYSGQIGDGSTFNRDTPAQVPGLGEE